MASYPVYGRNRIAFLHSELLLTRAPLLTSDTPIPLSRKAQASAEQEAAELRLKAEVQKPSASQPGRPAATGSKRSQSQLLAGVVKKKARTNSAGEPETKPAANAAQGPDTKEKAAGDVGWSETI